jgi:hypothetical protein
VLKPQSAGPVEHDKSKEIASKEDNFINEFHELAMEIKLWQKTKKAEIVQAVNLYGPLVAKAFPGRAAIPLKMLNLDETMIRAAYEKPQSGKIGHWIPGTRIPIVSDEALLVDHPRGSPILNLAWHIHTEISDYMCKQGYEGEFINII